MEDTITAILLRRGDPATLWARASNLRAAAACTGDARRRSGLLRRARRLEEKAEQKEATARAPQR